MPPRFEPPYAPTAPAGTYGRPAGAVPAPPAWPGAAAPAAAPAPVPSAPPMPVPSAPPVTPGGQPAGMPPTGAPPSYGPPAVPGAPPVLVRPAAGRSRLAVVAFVLAVVLALVTGVQAFQINRLSDRLGATDRALAEAQAADRGRLDGLQGRTDALEKQAGNVFNPEAIAGAVLPSVFRVRAGQSTGTAFAIGKPSTDGGTNLFTNFHVVDAVWESGERQVFLERTDQRFPATIIKVDKENDIAHLQTDGKFTGLVAAPEAVKSGQQIVVVGAPLGLEDSVSSGVVSAFRKSDDGSGTVIQFDAPINPGNSGGPVINGSKQVVGIATAKARDAEGIGLAVPIKTACDSFRIC
ncbi:S1C family serine protease [Micromonospora sp. CPCC 206060]